MSPFKLYISTIAVLCISVAHGQFQFRFEHIPKHQGIPGGSVMIQDSKGFIWMGTGRGVYRYDGYNSKLFINDPANKNNLTLNTIGALYEDRSGKIWLGTGVGPARFDPVDETFESFPFFSERINAGMIIKSITEDRHGNIWFTMRTDQDKIGGLVLFNHLTSSFEVFDFDGRLYSPSGISLDENGSLWLSSNSGIFIFDPVLKKLIKHFPSIFPDESGARGSNLSSVYSDGIGVMWATSYNLGVARITYDQSYNISVKTFQMKDGLMTNEITSMTKDSKRNYWFTTMGGMIVLNLKENTITNLRPSKENKNALKDGWCNSVLEDKSGVMWISYNDFGISKVTQNKGFIYITSHDLGFESLSGNQITSVYADPSDNIWMAVAGKGVHKIDFQSDFNKPPKISFYPKEGNYVNSMGDDRYGNLIMAVSNTGMSTLNPSTGQFKEVLPRGTSIARTLSDGSILLSDVWRLYRARKGGSKYSVDELIPDTATRKRRVWPEYSSVTRESENKYWLSTWQGDLYFYDNALTTFMIPTIHPRESLRIIDVYVDSNGFLWLTAFEGIFKFKVEHQDSGVKLNLVRKYTEKDGFISRSGASEIFTWAMEEDIHGNFWFAGAGLAQLNPKTDSIIHYYERDGVIEASSPLQGSAKLKNGYLVFGTPEGAYLFHPDSLITNRHIPPIEITSFTILNENSLITVRRKELKYFENVMSFEFSALDFTDPAKNQYAYQMVGFDPDWIYSGNRRTATYTNLNPGTYTFRVKGSNNDGVWNETGTSVEIVILPPPWKTWWAYTLYGLSILGLLILARNETVKRERLKSNAKLRELEVAQYHELDSLKSRFFANVSHEFRTPLTLLLGPIKSRLLKSVDPSDKAELTMMHRNALRLLELVNQLLDLSRLEGKTLKLRCRYLNAEEHLSAICGQFSSMADSKAINFQVHIESVSLYADPDKVEKIVTNLLSNAFKFTATGGSITLNFIEGAPTEEFRYGFAQLSVNDTGIGISADELPRIFDRFYQVDSGSARAFEGSGIGLALAKELVDLHHGSISVTSAPDKGSSFVVKFHLGTEHLKQHEIVNVEMEYSGNGIQANGLQYEQPFEIVDHGSRSDNGHLPHILIVEDNPDLQSYLRNSLKDTYVVSQATDGEQGVAKAIDEIPDLIISDLMMPSMDGLELCRKLKNNQKTSHIPIILLTARAGIDSKIVGLKTGADDYIAKPFDAGELQVRIFTLIDNRKKLQKKFSQNLTLSVSALQVESMEDKFLSKVKTAIEAHLDDPDLSVDHLASEVAMSSAQLYRKLKALTGSTPNEHIRNMRLERAASLLQQHAGNVSEVAYQVGFNNLSYFAKCFKEKFGVLPSEFIHKSQ